MAGATNSKATEVFVPAGEPSAERAAGAEPPADQSGYNWMLVVAGICMAGGIYPIVVQLVGYALVGVQFVVHAPWELELQKLVVGLGQMLLFALVFGIGGTLWTAVVSMFVVPVFYLFARTLKLRASMVWLGAICGGLVGLIALCPLVPLIAFAGVRPSSLAGPMLAIVLGPCSTTVLGQIGGACGGRWAQRERLSRRGFRPPRLSGEGVSRQQPAEGQGRHRPALQFQVRHLLWTTLWLAILLTAIRLAGLPFKLILPLLAAWLVFQAVTLYLGHLVSIRWRAGRGGKRST